LPNQAAGKLKSSRILDLATTWKCFASFTFRPHYARESATGSH